MPLTVSSLLSRGYFPSELPPSFNTRSFGQFAGTAAAATLKLDLSKKGVKNNVVTRPATHNLARAGRLRRKLTIPNPINQYQVARAIVEGWADIELACGKSTMSLTTPVFNDQARALMPAKGFRSLPLARARARTASRYLLKADVSLFYPSLYTHSIPWALHTKAAAKAAPNDFSMLGNVLDLAIRNGQDKQTFGIPIGPDTSLAIAEVVMSALDASLSHPMTKRGYRMIDDIGCGFRTLADAERALAELQSGLSEYELQLNNRKTRIIELPAAFDDLWVSKLRLYSFRSASAQQNDLLDYFDQAFQLAGEQRDSPILTYAIQRVRSVSITAKNWPLYESLLLQCLSVEPGTASVVIGELYRHHRRMSLDLGQIEEALTQVILDHSSLRHGSEVAWAIWGATTLKCRLDNSVIEQSLETADPCVSLCALHCHAAGNVRGPVNWGRIASLMESKELREEHWLLAYEANVKGWLPSVHPGDFVASDPYFGLMKAAHVSFFDETATPSVHVKPARGLFESLQDDLEDWEIEALLADVSGSLVQEFHAE